MSKYFNINNPNQIITITSEHDSFYQLSDGNMIKKESFMQKYQPVLDDIVNESIITEYKNSSYIDPNSFFNSSTILDNSSLNKIKNSDSSNAPEGTDESRREVKINNNNINNKISNDTLIKVVDEVVIPNNTNTDVSQYKVYDNDDDAYNDYINKSGIQVKPQKQIHTQTIDPMIEINRLYEDELMAFGTEEAHNRKMKRMNKIDKTPEIIDQNEFNILNNNEVVNIQTPVIDPIKMMFSTFKRNHEIKINVEFKDKIGNPDFIRMMMENMDGDIIDYYKKLIMDNIKKDLNKIEDIVQRELEIIILGEENKIETKEVLKDDKLILGKKTKSGKQLYQYINDNGGIVELLPDTAKKKGLLPNKK